jgi:membrane-bound lytic murein transglycosylase B
MSATPTIPFSENTPVAAAAVEVAPVAVEAAAEAAVEAVAEESKARDLPVSTFDFAAVPMKAAFIAANPPAAPVTGPTEEEIYAIQKAQVQTRIVQFFGRTASGSNRLTLRVGFMTEQDKTDLQTSLTAKGYTCAIEHNLLTIE